MPRLAPVIAAFVLAFVACAPTRGPAAGAYRFNGIDAQGEVHVFPLLHAYDAPSVRLDDYVTESVSPARARLRADRTRQLGEVPAAVADALPGAIVARVDPAWDADLRVARAPLGSRDRLLAALRRDDPAQLEAALIEVARTLGGDATLFSWVRGLDGEPVTTLDAPGTIIDTPQGSIVIDLFDDPYLVEAEVGVALVTADGHIVIRYADRTRALLAAHHGPTRAGRAMADALAAEVSKVWPDGLDRPTPRTALALRPHEPAPTTTPEVPFHHAAFVAARDPASNVQDAGPSTP